MSSSGGEVREFTRSQRVWTAIGLVLLFLLVGGAAAVQSFSHIVEVGLLTHQTLIVAVMMPLSIDGMMGIATIAILQDRSRGFVARPWARFGLWFGLFLSVAANASSIVAVWGWEWLSIVANGFPPILLLIAIEIVSKPSTRRLVLKAIATVDATLRRTQQPGQHGQAVTAKPGVRDGSAVEQQQTETSTPRDGQPATQPSTGPQTMSQTDPARRSSRPADEEPLPARLVEVALKVGRAHHKTTGRVITRDLLRERVRREGWPQGFSHRTGGRLLELITADVDTIKAGNDNTGQDDNDSITPATVTAGVNGRQ